MHIYYSHCSARESGDFCVFHETQDGINDLVLGEMFRILNERDENYSSIKYDGMYNFSILIFKLPVGINLTDKSKYIYSTWYFENDEPVFKLEEKTT